MWYFGWNNSNDVYKRTDCILDLFTILSAACKWQPWRRLRKLYICKVIQRSFCSSGEYIRGRNLFKFLAFYPQNNVFYSFFLFDLFSFFPNISQPAIGVLVNPFHTFFLRIGIIKPHAILRNSAHSLTSVVSVQNDMHDMERRRQIALKALSERLSRTTDSSRQKILPKSFPYHHHAHGHGHGHSHGHHHNFSDSDQPPFIASSKTPMEFTIPAIPLPPPPGMQSQIQAPPSDSIATPQNSSTNVLIDLNIQNDKTMNKSWNFDKNNS